MYYLRITHNKIDAWRYLPPYTHLTDAILACDAIGETFSDASPHPLEVTIEVERMGETSPTYRVVYYNGFTKTVFDARRGQQ